VKEPMSVLSVSEPAGRRDVDDPGLAGRYGSIWIVCAGATRVVSGGRVKCPRWGTVSAMECMACHLLVTVADERNPRRACSTAT
jgi:hypothetical protein